jgi:hypothetical protein
VVKLIIESKYAQNDIVFKQYINDTRKTCRSINLIIKNNNFSQTDNIARLIIGGNEVTSSPKMADFSKNLVNHLSSLINKCLYQGLFPNELKIAIVKPVLKSGAKTELNNYRPIAVLPIFSKVSEYAILNCLNAHLKNNHIISDFQFGFVSKSNTETAVLHIMSTIYNNIDSKRLSACM